MALRAVIDHPKFKRLKTLLKANMRTTLGTLEALWHFTGRFTPQGNIGKYSDEDIEAWLEWEGEPGELIKALIASRWVDETEHHRLVTHDWADHADEATRKQLKRNNLEFVSPTCPPHVPDISRLPGSGAEPGSEPAAANRARGETPTANATNGSPRAALSPKFLQGELDSLTDRLTQPPPVGFGFSTKQLRECLARAPNAAYLKRHIADVETRTDVQNKSAFLYRAILDDYAPPVTGETPEQQRERVLTEVAKKKQQEK